MILCVPKMVAGRMRRQSPIVARPIGCEGLVFLMKIGRWRVTCLIEVTSHPRATAYLQIREPRKPLPPQTMSFLAAADIAMVCPFAEVCS